ncbi:peptidoglycan DD-metalloendopeptidase family protein [Nonomuraea sp. NPDC004354]
MLPITPRKLLRAAHRQAPGLTSRRGIRPSARALKAILAVIVATALTLAALALTPSRATAVLVLTHTLPAAPSPSSALPNWPPRPAPQPGTNTPALRATPGHKIADLIAWPPIPDKVEYPSPTASAQTARQQQPTITDPPPHPSLTPIHMPSPDSLTATHPQSPISVTAPHGLSEHSLSATHHRSDDSPFATHRPPADSPSATHRSPADSPSATHPSSPAAYRPPDNPLAAARHPSNDSLTATDPLGSPPLTAADPSHYPPPATAAPAAQPPITAANSLPRLPPATANPFLPPTPTADQPLWRWPLDGRPVVIRRFSPPPEPWHAGHRGVDLAASPGARVRAAGPGTVTYAGPLAGRGVVSIQHPGGLRTTYLPVRASVRRGQTVSTGDELGVIEPTSWHCITTCLHWGLRREFRYLDPLLLLGLGPIRLLPHWPTPPASSSTS